MARQVRIQVQGAFVARMLEEGNQIWPVEVKNGLPPGARFVRCFDEMTADTFSLVYEHETFRELKSGDVIPILVPVMVSGAERRR
jgi:hypothetical protein